MKVRKPLGERFRLAVVIADDFEDDIMVWTAIEKVVGDRLDAAMFVRHPNDAAARWGHWHWTSVHIYGEAEEDEFMEQCSSVLIVGPKDDSMLEYYRDLAKYYHKPVAWASPKE